MKRYFIYTTLFLALTVPSCKHKHHGSDESSTTAVTEALSPESVMMLDKVRATQVPYKWFAATGYGRIDWDGQRMSARINVRILHDSIIWVQIQKFGFELGRMLVTPDSAIFINRFEHTYSRYCTKDFLREYNVPADFDMFSLVFTAGAYIPPVIKNAIDEDDGSVYIQSGTGMNARHWFDASSLLTRSLIIDPADREWTTGYADYKRTNSGQRFPYKRSNTLVIDGKANIFDLEYNEMLIDIPQQFPFSIPSHYEKI